MRGSTVIRVMLCAALLFSFVVAAPASAGAVMTSPWRWLNRTSDGTPRGDTLQAVSMSPAVNSDVVWAVGNYGAVMKSYNGGDTWYAKSSPTTKTLNDVDMLDDNTGWAVGVGPTIIKITGGATCTLQTNLPATADDLYAVDAVSPLVAWAVGYNGDILKTVDGGATWTFMGGSQTADTVGDNNTNNTIYTSITMINETQGYIGGQGNTGANNVFFINSGLAYNKSTADTDFQVEDLALDTATSTLWVVGKVRSGSAALAYKVTDAAHLISATNLDLSYGVVPTPPALINGYPTSLAKADATHMWVTTTGGYIVSFNGTSFVSAVDNSYPGAWQNDIDFRADTSPTAHYQGIYVGEAGIAGRTGDGITWAKRQSSIDRSPMAVDFISTTVGYATTGSDVLKTTDSGTSWSTTSPDPSLGLMDVDFRDASNGWAVGRAGAAVYNNGTSWVSRTTGLDATKDLYSVSYVNATNLWACGDAGAIYKGNGTDWAAQTSNAGADLLYSIDFFDANHGIAVGNNGTVVYTGDGGVTWTAGSSGVSAFIFSVDMVSDTTGYMVGLYDSSTGALLMRKTTNGGATWNPMTPPASVPTWIYLNAVSFADASNGWIVGAAGTIMHTTDGGLNWTKENMCDESLTVVSAVSPSAAWAGGNSGILLTNYTAPVPPSPTTVYRFFNLKNGTHLYTSDYAEKLKIIASWPDIYRFEGVGYVYAGYKATQPLYRFFNMKNGSHFYTATEEEKAKVIANWSSIYKYEGPAYNISNTPLAGATTVWRFFRYDTGSHFYTADPAERDRVKANWPTIYRYEGEAYWLPQ